MVEMSALAPGMRVKIVDEYTDDCLANEDGLMDGWRGKVMTVRKNRRKCRQNGRGFD